MKKKMVFWGMILLLVVNFIFSETSPFFADVLSLVYSFFCAGAILYFSRKDKEYKILWIFVSVIPISWAFEKFHVMMGYRVFPSTLEDFTGATILLLIPEIAMAIVVILFMIKGFRKIYWTKFVLDTIFILIILLGVGSGVVFSQLNLSSFDMLVFIYMMVNVVIDIIVVASLLLLLTSVNRKRVDNSLYIIAGAFAAFIYADFDHMYEYIVVDYQVAFFSDELYIISFLLMLVGAMVAKRARFGTRAPMEQKPENLTNTRVVLYLMILPIYLYLIGNLSITHLTLMSIAVIVYQYLNFFMQRAFRAEQDISEKEQLMKELEYLVSIRTEELTEINKELYIKSTTDSLTGLYNRSYLMEAIDEKIANQTPVILLKVSIEKFWMINSYHGNELGDQVLIEVSNRFKNLERKDVVTARISGSKFAVLIPNKKEYSHIEETDRLLDIVKEPVNVNGFSFQLEMNAGIARYPEDAESSGELFRDAALAMNYVRHQSSKNDVALYSYEMIQKMDRLNHIEMLLRDADFEKDFELYYQPKFDVTKNQLIGMEALIRWNHKEEGFISPSEFIPVAEETGLIVGISNWVFRHAMEQIFEWNKTFDKELKMSMNVSSVSLDRLDFVDSILDLIKETKVDSRCVELEITEYMAVSSESKSSKIFSELRKNGISISIDDFGTGYSSLSYMKKYEVDVLKIARELVMNIVDDQKEKLIVQAIVTMAKGMGISIIAEGVEEDSQMSVLQSLGCENVQGYLTGRPESKETFEKLYLAKG
jgi:diguanylate cyclase (GGDEF)-like protein